MLAVAELHHPFHEMDISYFLATKRNRGFPFDNIVLPLREEFPLSFFCQIVVKQKKRHIIT